eukprot:6077987-Pleurochrysis_carterae.AAC.1
MAEDARALASQVYTHIDAGKHARTQEEHLIQRGQKCAHAQSKGCKGEQDRAHEHEGLQHICAGIGAFNRILRRSHAYSHFLNGRVRSGIPS